MKTKTGRNRLAHLQPSALVALRPERIASHREEGEASCVNGVCARGGGEKGDSHHLLIKSHTHAKVDQTSPKFHRGPREPLWRDIKNLGTGIPSEERGKGGRDLHLSLYILSVFF